MSTPITQRTALIALAQRLSEAKEVAFDTEFHGETTYWPKLMLIQLATRDEVAVVDPLAHEVRPALGGLFEMLRLKGVRIIGHALEQDLLIYHRITGALPAGVFDTQIAAAFLGYGDRIGLGPLLEQRVGVNLDKLYTRADWGRRPLPEAQLAYAVSDVAHLFELTDALRADLEARGRTAWVEEETQASLLNPADYAGRAPEEAYRWVSRRPADDTPEAKILRALAAERERVAQEIDEPPRRLVPDDVLVDLARRAPDRPEDLVGGTHRRPTPALTKHQDRWLTAIRDAAGAPDTPAPPRRSAEAEEAANLLKLVIHHRLRHEDLAPRLVWPRVEPHLDVLLAAPPTDRAELLQTLGMDGWRAELLGDVLTDVLQGKISPRLAAGQAGLQVELG
ncbi:MAG: ribonuclease D [Myxococcales bacterium]|nr:ribonuclease D [Myxococcales bacterium]MCB9651291.1 ribonuclease D [Deltaproteobacteria bacterium]